MRLTIVDARALAVALCLPMSNQFFNWTSGAWETPFNPANHLKPFTRVAGAPDINLNLQTIDLGNVIESRDDCVATIYAQSPGATPYTLVDVAASPFPMTLGTLAVVTRL